MLLLLLLLLLLPLLLLPLLAPSKGGPPIDGAARARRAAREAAVCVGAAPAGACSGYRRSQWMLDGSCAFDRRVIKPDHNGLLEMLVAVGLLMQMN
jgi:hypothetical protein